MDETTLDVRRADGEDLSYVERNGLPTGDVRSKPGCLYVVYDGENRVGIGGLPTGASVPSGRSS